MNPQDEQVDAKLSQKLREAGFMLPGEKFKEVQILLTELLETRRRVAEKMAEAILGDNYRQDIQQRKEDKEKIQRLLDQTIITDLPNN